MDINHYKKHEPFFGSWYITKFLGNGNFGKVFEIEREDFGETYRAALKIITVPQNESEVRHVKNSGLDDTSVFEYFESVVKNIVSNVVLMSKLKGNSNIVSYEDHMVVPHEEKLGWDIFIRMELLTPLMDYAEDTKLTLKDIIRLGIDICHALELYQGHNLIHRGITPERIFVSDNGNFKLGDSGLTITLGEAISDLSIQGANIYMAPEIRKGEKFGFNSDIYSLGLVMYRLLNENRMPFLSPYPEKIGHSDISKALDRRLSGEKLPAPSGADERLAEIVLKACSYNPDERYSNPSQMREELEAIACESYNADPYIMQGKRKITIDLETGTGIHGYVLRIDETTHCTSDNLVLPRTTYTTVDKINNNTFTTYENPDYREIAIVSGLKLEYPVYNETHPLPIAKMIRIYMENFSYFDQYIIYHEGSTSPKCNINIKTTATSSFSGQPSSTDIPVYIYPDTSFVYDPRSLVEERSIVSLDKQHLPWIHHAFHAYYLHLTLMSDSFGGYDNDNCCLFTTRTFGEPGKGLPFRELENLGGGDGEGFSWKDGSRKLCCCANCGALFLNYRMKFLEMIYDSGTITYNYYIPVADREQALEYSEKYIGDYGLDKLYIGKKIWYDSKKWHYEP